MENIYTLFYTFMTYFFPAEILEAYPQVFVFLSVVITLALVFALIRFIWHLPKKMFGGQF